MVEFNYEDFLKERNKYLTALTKVFDGIYLSNQSHPVSYTAINDMQQLLNEWAKVARQIPAEIVKCKRRKGSTPHYRELIKEYNLKHEHFKNKMVLFLLEHSR